MTDEDLIQGFQTSGDAQLLDALVSRHVGRIRSVIYPIVLNDADADDLTQEVFIKAVRGIRGFRARSRFSTWLYRVAMNVTRGFLRSKGRDRITLNETFPDEPDPGPAPEEQVIAREEERALRAALAALPSALRSAFTLVVLQGLAPREAAYAEGCFLSTIYRRVSAARKELARALER